MHFLMNKVGDYRLHIMIQIDIVSVDYVLLLYEMFNCSCMGALPIKILLNKTGVILKNECLKCILVS